jgi:cytochrome c oxidase subunit 2
MNGPYWKIQSVLGPAGPQAASVEWLWWVMFWVCTAVFVLVLGALTIAVFRGRSAGHERAPERSLHASIATATGATIVVLFVLLFVSTMTGRAIISSSNENALVVEIVGHQWWWEITYTDPQPSRRVTTANELHLPTGRPVVFMMKAPDVIHSLWIPNLHGKMDLVPGRLTTLLLQVDKPGIYRGQCAEFCGVQHARMALTAIAESPSDFDAWIRAQQQTPPAPSTSDEQRGLAIFQQGACMMCHTVRGTSAAARLGPDLTHVATRSTLGAGTLPNTPENLAKWIADPQHVKPGNRMPPTGLSPEEINAVVAYLQVLK